MSECPECGNQYTSLNQHYVNKPSHRPESESACCHSCGKRYKQVVQHWSIGSCDFPPLSDKQKEIAIGLALGDAHVNGCNKNAHLDVSMVSEEFLEWVDSHFPVLGTGVSLKQTASESYERAVEDPFMDETTEDAYSDVYRWRSRGHPFFNNLLDWYGEDGKRFPQSLSLTPTIVTVWICCDGSVDDDGIVSIHSTNEADNLEKLVGWFNEVGFTDLVGTQSHERLRFRKEGSRRLLNWIQEVPDGFEYKLER